MPKIPEQDAAMQARAAQLARVKGHCGKLRLARRLKQEAEALVDCPEPAEDD